MIKQVARSLTLALAAFGLTGLVPAHATTIVDRDCGDFATQAAAQAFMLASGPGDPHGLDSDNDGRACESNPCPCGAAAPQPFVGGSSSTQDNTQPQPDPVRRNRGNVVKVIDGDTLKVRLRGIGVRSVRLIGIDTPEVYGGTQCGGKDASERMRELAPVGSTVRLISDPSQADRDRYGRLLRYVERRGKDVGRAQVNLGQAKVYVYNHKPFRRTSNYQRVQRNARQNGRGSWSSCW